MFVLPNKRPANGCLSEPEWRAQLKLPKLDNRDHVAVNDSPPSDNTSSCVAPLKLPELTSKHMPADFLTKCPLSHPIATSGTYDHMEEC